MIPPNTNLDSLIPISRDQPNAQLHQKMDDKAKQRWNREYRSGRWDLLENDSSEKARSAIIAMYCSHFFPSAKILDIGCGVGILSDFLNADQKQNYLGIDLSSIAANTARQKRNLRVLTEKAEDFQATESFDVIVFNEVLYYLDSDEILRRYTTYLRPNGIIVVSAFRIWHPFGRWRLWRLRRALGHHCITIEHLKVVAERKVRSLVWDISVLRSKNSL